MQKNKNISRGSKSTSQLFHKSIDGQYTMINQQLAHEFNNKNWNGQNGSFKFNTQGIRDKILQEIHSQRQTLEVKKAFEEVIRTGSSSLVLAYLNFNLPFEIEYDASNRGFAIHTDQKSLKHLWEHNITTADKQWWMAKLLGFH